MSGCQRQTVPQHWPSADKTAVTELVARSLDQARSIVSKPQSNAKYAILLLGIDGKLINQSVNHN